VARRGNTKSQRAEQGVTGKQADAGHYMTWGGGGFALSHGGWRGLGRKSATPKNKGIFVVE